MKYKVKQTFIIFLIFVVMGAVILSFYPFKKIPEIAPIPVMDTIVKEKPIIEEPKLPEPCYDEAQVEIDCDFLTEKTFIEKYIKDNIKTIATNQPVLGGSWYVTSILIIPSSHTGEVTYEDGHIQSKAEFTYTYEKDPQNVNIKTFEIIKE